MLRVLTRRAILAGALTAPLAGCGLGSGGELIGGCRTPESLSSFETLGGAPMSYALTATKQAFRADPRFFSLLDDWAFEWVDSSGFGALTEVVTYGAYVDKCDSWHAAGRAFDFAELRHETGSVSCRYDLWGDDQRQLRPYWRLAASLGSRFTYTLTYLYNEQHHNHIHIDNAVSGAGPASYDSRSKAQTQLLQGVLRHVFGKDCATDGRLDTETKRAAREVQEQLRIEARLASPEGWTALLGAAARG